MTRPKKGRGGPRPGSSPGRPPEIQGEVVRITFKLSKDQMARLDAYGARKGLVGRAAALRDLIERHAK